MNKFIIFLFFLVNFTIVSEEVIFDANEFVKFDNPFKELDISETSKNIF